VKEEQLNKWIENFNREMEGIQVSFDAFFLQKKIERYYSIKVDKEHNNLTLEMLSLEGLPNEIVNRIIDAFAKAKPI
jgi:hypothetical protein